MIRPPILLLLVLVPVALWLLPGLFVPGWWLTSWFSLTDVFSYEGSYDMYGRCLDINRVDGWIVDGELVQIDGPEHLERVLESIPDVPPDCGPDCDRLVSSVRFCEQVEPAY